MNTIYQKALTDITRDTCDYNIIANTWDKNQEEHYHLHEDTNGTYWCDVPVYNHSINNPYDKAVWNYRLSINSLLSVLVLVHFIFISCLLSL